MSLIRKYFNKLVRDKIPEIIVAAGLECNTQILSQTVYKKALRKKLLEEAQEASQAESEGLLEELADLYEVIEAILVSENISKDELLSEQKKRQKERGGFEQKIQLNWTTTEKGSSFTDFSHLKVFQEYLKQEVSPKAEILDQDWPSLKKALLELGELNLLALKAPQHLGGREWDDLTFYQWQMSLARYSGALAFLQTQHQSAASQITASNNEQLKERYLPYMGNGEILIGVGVSQLRRQGKPDLVAIAVSGGYLLEGTVPWITGYGIFSEFIVGASLDNGESIYGLVPFTPVSGQISLSPPLNLLAVPSTNTVEAQINQWFLPEEQVIALKPANSLQVNDHKNVLHHGYMALGCARGGLDLLEAIAGQKSLPFLEKTEEQLLQEWTQLEALMFSNQEITYQERLKYRVKAINLAGRCGQSVVVASGGSANLREHRAGRIYREALLFSVSGQTLDVLKGSLDLLTR